MKRGSETPEERYAFAVAEAAAYRQRQAAGTAESVEELLDRHHAYRELLAALLDEDATELDLSIEGAAAAVGSRPETIGSYRIVGELGSGGMGTVYVAEQSEPVRRRVALKLIRPGLDNAQLLARFEAERQALAVMQHPNIVRILESGTTAEGQLFFAMELVSGVRITEYCGENQLDTQARLRLFFDVCLAVHYAHQKGIIHRDLKPSNILTELRDGRPVPRIIDFGIAKAVAQPFAERALLTEDGQLVGTPEYMSPEQAERSGTVTDIRTDIYSLGVLLYEITTGCLPFDADELRYASAEAGRAIRRDPPAPSARVGLAGPVPARDLRGDLDWITLRALELEPERRYQSASELAADIQRHLRDEPVLVSPPSTLYRARKFARRYRAQVIVGALAAVVLLAGAVGTALYARRTARLAVDADHQRGIAQAKQAEVVRHLSQYRLLRHGIALDAAELAVWTRPFPAWPESTEALETWLRERGEPLEAAREEVAAVLAGLRSRALPWTPEEQRRDRAAHAANPRLLAAARKLAELERELVTLDLQVRPEYRDYLVANVRSYRDQVARLEEEVQERLTYDFKSDADRFLQRALAKLDGNLEAFCRPAGGELSRARKRLAWAKTIHRRSIDEHRDRWDRALAAIAAADGVVANRLYAQSRLRKGLRPQVGLVPIGMNPATKLWEFYHLGSAANPDTIPEHDTETGDIEVTEDTGIVFVLLPGGEFVMGAQSTDAAAPHYDPQAASDEGPVHRVTLDPFFIAKHEMTQGQWSRLTDGTDPSFYDGGFRHRDMRDAVTRAHPVENVEYGETSARFAIHGLALPTEAQWEYACRAGTPTPYWTGVDERSLARRSNLFDVVSARSVRSPIRATMPGDGHIVHAPVGSYPANGFGLHDMHGNVSEWCGDGFSSYARDPAPGDGARSNSNDSIVRGGDFMDRAEAARSSTRRSYSPPHMDSTIGIRPSRKIVWPTP